MTERATIAFAEVAALLLVVPPATAAAPRTHTVVMDKMTFGAVPAQVKVGDTILWVNRDLVRHTATAKGLFDVDLKPGETKRTVVKKAGATPFVCRYHPGMRGVLRVSGR